MSRIRATRDLPRVPDTSLLDQALVDTVATVLWGRKSGQFTALITSATAPVHSIIARTASRMGVGDEVAVMAFGDIEAHGLPALARPLHVIADFACLQHSVLGLGSVLGALVQVLDAAWASCSLTVHRGLGQGSFGRD